MQALSVSLIIPAYNESETIGSCLRSALAQTVPFHEIIVIDNNSTDETALLAAGFPGVTVLKESRQGQVFAQQVGFDRASGTILGRIDADTVLPADWVARVQQAFAENPGAVAFTGGAAPYDINARRLGTAIFELYRSFMSSLFSGTVMLWGSNTALTKAAWKEIRGEVHMRRDIWEDFDMTFCLAGKGKILYRPGVKVGCSFRTFHKPIPQMFEYQMRSVRTVFLRKGRVISGIYLLCWLTMLLFIPVQLLDRAINYLFGKRNLRTLSTEPEHLS